MFKPWQEFRGDEVSKCASIIDQQFIASAIGGIRDNSELESHFLLLFDGVTGFSPEDGKLLRSAKRLIRVFTLPNDHSRGLYFFGAQGNDFSANGASDTAIGAIRSCLGEALERWIHQNPTIACDKCVDPQAFPLSKPLNEVARWLAEQQGCSELRYEKDMRWVMASSLTSDEKLLIPVDYAFRIQESTEVLHQSATNGMATGPDVNSAITSALLELIERDTLALWWYGGCTASQLHLERNSRFKLMAFTSLARRNSVRPMWLVSIDNEFQIPVIVAMSADGNGQRVVVGISAHTDVHAACCSAICELGQMELGLQLVEMKLEQGGQNSLNDNDFRQLYRMQQLGIHDYPELFPHLSVGTTIPQKISNEKSMLSELVDRINKAGYKPYIIDMTEEPIGVPCYKAVIPGLESGNIEIAGSRLKNLISQSGGTVEMLRSKPSLI